MPRCKPLEVPIWRLKFVGRTFKVTICDLKLDVAICDLKLEVTNCDIQLVTTARCMHMADAIMIPGERIEKAILLIRGQKVMLDQDLAQLYEVPIKRLNEQVRRNHARFPEDFMFHWLPKKRPL